MGVAGLWDVLRPAAKTRSLTELAVVDGFQRNKDGVRGLRIGIDASIWFFHANYGREGENPELRTLFFRCAKLLTVPFLPVFVFDGPKRPSVKRGKKISGNSHWLTEGVKNIVVAFGFEWITAPGEAEAELAYLNRIGIIDSILSDDVDTFLFGATMVIRNSSATLTGNNSASLENAAGKNDGNHTMTYSMKDITSMPEIDLTIGGLILIGLLSGGDYHTAGVTGCGPKIAHGLARAGLGDALYEAAIKLSKDDLPKFLEKWRSDLIHELKTNESGCLQRKAVAVAKTITDDFPNIEILMSYVKPITSETEGRKVNKITWEREPSVSKIAECCELYFEWGVKEVIVKRFRTVLWPGIICRSLRRSVIELDRRALLSSPVTPRKNGEKERFQPGTPSSMIRKHFASLALDSPSKKAGDLDDPEQDDAPMITSIHSQRTHASTDMLLEYRLEIDPRAMVRAAEAGVRGIRPPLTEDGEANSDAEDGKGTKRKGKWEDPDSTFRMWMPALMVDPVEKGVVDDFNNRKLKKADKKKKPAATAKAKKAADEPKAPTSKVKAPSKVKSNMTSGTANFSDSDSTTGLVRKGAAPVLPLELAEKQVRATKPISAAPKSKPSSARPALPRPTKSAPAKVPDGQAKSKAKPGPKSSSVTSELVKGSITHSQKLFAQALEEDSGSDSLDEKYKALFNTAKGNNATRESKTKSRSPFEDDEDGEFAPLWREDSPTRLKVLTTPSPRGVKHTRKNSFGSSSTESFDLRLKKSPRKEKKHKSPRVPVSLDDETSSSSDVEPAVRPSRPVSPSPYRPSPRREIGGKGQGVRPHLADLSIISISSDDSPIKPRPATARTTSNKSMPSALARKRSPTSEVIDLT
ncbi:hypothetical protein SISSUDRAFT_1113531 [Sistotremastrum suecicum HHB10207 ss-3]|uniref:XPG-I domain-containing protein n=1 Tax=Sistotremastrum suecicum HHB10207 ss-3 TaxID=1314776 RepID=A0A166EP74_9AGAM|nr:hypothetical protein SISSUDRAFT_1113531 [Sistotremastrum suecicum HHB10207 ss-3]